jgi:sugar phosphate isomerase/epimerase
MVMLLGYNTNGFAHHRLVDALQILADIGYRSIALTLDYHALNPYDAELAEQLTRVGELLRDNDLRCVIETGARFLLDPWHKHQPTLLDADPLRRARRRDFLKRAIDVAEALDADALSFWSGSLANCTLQEGLVARLAAECRELCVYARPRGIPLAFEPEPGMLIDTMPRFEELFRAVDDPTFGLTLDIGHLHCMGETSILDHLRRWKDRLWNVHIEDMRRGVHDHLMFGEGEINFGEVLGGLREISYSGGVHVELSRHSHNAVETARRAFEFLNSC